MYQLSHSGREGALWCRSGHLAPEYCLRWLSFQSTKAKNFLCAIWHLNASQFPYSIIHLKEQQPVLIKKKNCHAGQLKRLSLVTSNTPSSFSLWTHRTEPTSFLMLSQSMRKPHSNSELGTLHGSGHKGHSSDVPFLSSARL